MRAKSGVKSSAEIVLKDTASGKIIYAGMSIGNTAHWKAFHTFRTQWCNYRELIVVDGEPKYSYPTRKMWTPKGYREGKVNLITLSFWIYLVIKQKLRR